MTTPDSPERSTRPSRSDLKSSFPNPLPTDPAAILAQWLNDAALIVEGDTNIMMLATSTPTGAPSVRPVLCKGIEQSPPAVLFYTNYHSRKGRELELNPRAAGVFYWPALERQARIEGAVTKTTDAESDAYFRSRPLLSRLGSIASRQSQPLPSRATLAARVMRTAITPGAASLRPPHWGGFRVLLDRIELWAAGQGRMHDRVEWILSRTDGLRWVPTRLYP